MTTPKTVAELRAEIAKGCQQAAKVWRDAAKTGLRGADRMADALERDTERNERLAK